MLNVSKVGKYLSKYVISNCRFLPHNSSYKLFYWYDWIQPFWQRCYHSPLFYRNWLHEKSHHLSNSIFLKIILFHLFSSDFVSLLRLNVFISELLSLFLVNWKYMLKTAKVKFKDKRIYHHQSGNKSYVIVINKINQNLMKKFFSVN